MVLVTLVRDDFVLWLGLTGPRGLHDMLSHDPTDAGRPGRWTANQPVSIRLLALRRNSANIN